MNSEVHDEREIFCATRYSCGSGTEDRTAGPEGLPVGGTRQISPAKQNTQTTERSAFDRVVLLLQGGGAFGAYQAGVYEALAEANLHPDWVAGISIGAINATIIAGNPPNLRVEKLRQFWEGITNSWFDAGAGKQGSLLARGDSARGSVNQMSAAVALTVGRPVSSDRESRTDGFIPRARSRRQATTIRHSSRRRSSR